MKTFYTLLLVMLFAAFFLGCKKDPYVDSSPSNTHLAFDTKDVKVIIPANSNFKLAGAKVFSYGTEQSINASGTSKVAFEKGSITTAYLFDANKKLVMAGFITDNTNEISPASTAKVLLYLGYNIPLQPDTLSTYFLKNIDALPGAKAWEKEFEVLFVADPLVLSKRTFIEPLKKRMADMIGKFDPADIRQLKMADIHVDGQDVRSGIQVADDGLSKFKVINNYRRRAHAFLYKMSYKDMNGVAHPVKNKLEAGTKADKDKGISPVSAVTGFLSEIGKNIEGKGLESFAVTSGPYPWELEEQESEAIYKLRVVGPGIKPSSSLTITEAEMNQITRLEVETFLLDFVIPAISLVASVPDKPTAGVMPDVDRASKGDALLSLLKKIPDVYDEIKQGNYKAALNKFLIEIYKDAQGELLKEVFMIALDRESITGGVGSYLNERFENFLYILQMTDAALGASDLIRISADISSSKNLEEWEIKAKSSQVRLSPKESSVISFKEQKITAVIKNLDESGDTHPFFKWTTSGKYGKISDTKGHSGTSFESSDKIVNYYSNASQASLRSCFKTL